MQGEDRSSPLICPVSFLVAISVDEWIPLCPRSPESVQNLLLPTVLSFLVQSSAGHRPSTGVWDLLLTEVEW